MSGAYMAGERIHALSRYSKGLRARASRKAIQHKNHMPLSVFWEKHRDVSVGVNIVFAFQEQGMHPPEIESATRRPNHIRALVAKLRCEAAYFRSSHRRRPYRVECTGSLSTSEVKQHRARLVLGWGTAWEDLRVLSAFAFDAFV